jgi:spore maturation protein CgeB
VSRRLVVFGLSLSSSWGNGHAIPFRGLCHALAERGWRITFFERDVEWYRSNRDVTDPPYADLRLYADLSEVFTDAHEAVWHADAVLVGSYVPEGAELIDWLAERDRPLYFYDIDTPVTLTTLHEQHATDYVRADQIPLFEVYFSFTGGPALDELRQTWGARAAQALYCAVDPHVYRPVPTDSRFECLLGYMGTYAADRQSRLEDMLIDTARQRPADRFLIAGAQYPPMDVPPNVDRHIHLYPREHAAFYVSNTATLNLTRDAMRRYGWSPASRLFEAAACGACIISDSWPGLSDLLEPGRDVLIADNGTEVRAHLDALTPDRRQQVGAAARKRVLSEHTFGHRAEQLERALLGTPLAIPEDVR